MLQQKIGPTKCPTKVVISSDTGKFWSAIVRLSPVICSPAWCIFRHFKYNSRARRTIGFGSRARVFSQIIRTSQTTGALLLGLAKSIYYTCMYKLLNVYFGNNLVPSAISAFKMVEWHWR